MRNSYANISSTSPITQVGAMDFYEYGDIRFFTDGGIGIKKKDICIKRSGTTVSEQITLKYC